MKALKFTVIVMIMSLFSFSILANSVETAQFVEAMKAEQEQKKTQKKRCVTSKRYPRFKRSITCPVFKLGRQF